jgi:hypothetical protein
MNKRKDWKEAWLNNHVTSFEEDEATYLPVKIEYGSLAGQWIILRNGTRVGPSFPDRRTALGRICGAIGKRVRRR